MKLTILTRGVLPVERIVVTLGKMGKVPAISLRQHGSLLFIQSAVIANLNENWKTKTKFNPTLRYYDKVF